MAYQFKVVRRVEFSETDMAGIVHHSNFFRYMESAEHGFFRSLGFSVVMRNFEAPMGWPRVHVECDFWHPLKFEDEFEVLMLVSRKRPKALSYVFKFTKLNGRKRIEVARGSLIAVCVIKKADGSLAAAKIPKAVADKISVAPARLLK